MVVPLLVASSLVFKHLMVRF